MTLGSLGILAVIVFVSGVIGGFFNGLRTDNGNFGSVTVPLGGAAQQQPPAGQPPAGWRPGLGLNMLTGGAAALLSWALYGPLAGLNILNLSEATQQYAMTLSAIGGAFFVGFGGARWLSAEADKRILQTSNNVIGDAASTAADNAAGVSGNAAEISNTAADVAAKAAEVATAAATATNDPQLEAGAQQVRAQAQEIREQAQQIGEQAQGIQGQSQQLKDVADQVKVAETPAKVLDIAQRSVQAVGTG
jgi:hypothetical protein